MHLLHLLVTFVPPFGPLLSPYTGETCLRITDTVDDSGNIIANKSICCNYYDKGTSNGEMDCRYLI